MEANSDEEIPADFDRELIRKSYSLPARDAHGLTEDEVKEYMREAKRHDTRHDPLRP